MKKSLCVVLSFLFILSAVTFAHAAYYDEGNDGFTEANAYIIDSIGDLITLRNRVNNGEEPDNAYYRLNMPNKTMNLSEYTGWIPIGTGNAFKGHFDGNGHTIYMNITNRAGSTASLFGTIATESGYAVKDLTVDASGSYSINGRYAAGIADSLFYSSIENCTFTGNLRSYYEHDSSRAGSASAGGIVRCMYSGSIKNSNVNRASIIAHTYNPYFWGYDLGTGYAGGVAAIMYGGSIEDCVVQTDTSIQAYSSRYERYDNTLLRPSYAGGIAGYSTLEYDEGIKSCSVIAEVFSSNYAGGIIGQLNDGTLENNQVIGSSIDGLRVAGGIGGYLQGTTLRNNHVQAAEITATTDTAGGIAGYLTTGAIAESNDIAVGSNVTSNGDNSGGIVGVLESATVRNNTSYATISGNASHKGGVVGKIDSANFTIEGNKYSGARFGIGYDASGAQSDNPGCEHIGAAISITTSSPLPNANAGSSYSQTFASDSEESVTWSHVSGDLPAGLTLNTSTGRLSGTPTTAGTFTFTIGASTQSSSTSMIFTLTVNLVITTESILPNATAGTSYTQTLSAAGASSITWTRTAGTLPSGLTLNTNGRLSGTPSAAGTFDFTIQADAGNSIITAKAFRLTVDPAAAINITTTSLPSGKVGTSYSATLAASETGVTWSVSQGSLPAGLTLNSSTGAISGTPTSAGTSTFTIRAVKGLSSGTRQLSITIAPADTAISITTTNLPAGTVGTSYSAQLAASVSNASWSISSGSLPGGLTLSTAGVISGTPTTAGTFTFTVRAASGSTSTTRALSITINAATLTITTSSLPDGVVGDAYRQTLQASASGVTWSISSGSLPDGLSLTGSTGLISGTFSRAGSYKFTVAAGNNYAGAVKTFTINVTDNNGGAGGSSGGGGCNSGLGLLGAVLCIILKRK